MSKRARNTWDRREDETETDWKYFKHFRDSGIVRRNRIVSAAFSVSEQLIGKIAKKHKWRDRCFDFDWQQDQIEQAKLSGDLAKMRHRHLKMSRDLQTLAAIEIAKLLERAQDPKDKFAMPAREVTAMMKAMAELERLTLGQPTERHEHTVDYGGMPTADLEKLKVIMDKAAAKPAVH